MAQQTPAGDWGEYTHPYEAQYVSARWLEACPQPSHRRCAEGRSPRPACLIAGAIATRDHAYKAGSSFPNALSTLSVGVDRPVARATPLSAVRPDSTDAGNSGLLLCFVARSVLRPGCCWKSGLSACSMPPPTRVSPRPAHRSKPSAASTPSAAEEQPARHPWALVLISKMASQEAVFPIDMRNAPMTLETCPVTCGMPQ